MATTTDGTTVGLLLEDNSLVNVPKWEADLLVTDSPIDPVDERNIRANYVAGKLLEVLLETDVRVTEIKFILDKVGDSLFDNHSGSVNKFFSVLIKRASGGVCVDQKSLRTGFVDAVLKDEEQANQPKA